MVGEVAGGGVRCGDGSAVLLDGSHGPDTGEQPGRRARARGSYHHIFFSQNARGYTAYVFFSLLSSTLLGKAIADSRLRTWALYVGAMVLNMASLLIGGFVLASHLAVGLGIAAAVGRARRSVGGVVSTLTAVFAITALLVFQLYALIIPRAYVVMKSVYTQSASGYSLASGDFVNELLRGVLVGFGSAGGWKIVPVLVLAVAVGGHSFARLSRRGPAGWTGGLTAFFPAVVAARHPRRRGGARRLRGARVAVVGRP